jgi:hypothetical protein
MSRIVGLNDLKKKNDESKEEKKQNQFFAGGLDQRGFDFLSNICMIFTYFLI